MSVCELEESGHCEDCAYMDDEELCESVREESRARKRREREYEEFED